MKFALVKLALHDVFNCGELASDLVYNIGLVRLVGLPKFE